MKNKLFFLLILLNAACSQDRFSIPGGALATAQAIGTNAMVMQVGTCGPYGYANEPCVSVTICTPGTSTCQTIPNILVDTGSYGLRIFSSVLSIPLNQETDSLNRPIAECAYFGSSNDWGPVEMADVQLGGETAHNIPIHVFDSTYAKVPTPCTSPLTGPSAGGWNGILGVGVFNQDCGLDCTTDATNQTYYACVGTTCTNITVTLGQQVSNPVVSLPLDNNGVSLQLPGVSFSGAPTLTGTLTFGIATQSDNTPSGVTVYPADTDGNFITVFNGTSYPASFIDSGSNGLFFPPPKTLTACAANVADGFFCPTAPASFTGTQKGYLGTPQNIITFEIYSASTLFSTGNNAFNDLGGTTTGAFDWGFPFFLGRTIYVGIEGTSSSIGAGGYWAY